MVKLATLPRCPCGADGEKGSGQSYFDVRCNPNFSTDTYRCSCGRIALRQGFERTRTHFLLRSKAPMEEFSESINDWIEGPLSDVFGQRQDQGTYDEDLSMPNPEPDTVDLYFPDAAGKWVLMTGLQ